MGHHIRVSNDDGQWIGSLEMMVGTRKELGVMVVRTDKRMTIENIQEKKQS